MMNQSQRQPIGYDPCDQRSFPYQGDDPPFDASRLQLDPLTEMLAPEISLLDQLNALGYEGESADYRTFDMALRLFTKMTQDEAYFDIDYPSLFAAALHTALIWERG